MVIASNRIFEVSQLIRFSVETKNSSGVLTDPTALKFRIKPIIAAEYTKSWSANAEVVKDSTGKFHIDYTLLEEGEHPVRWEATGTIQTAKEEIILARDGAFN